MNVTQTGELIAQWREERGWTQEKLAQVVGCHRVTIARAEAGSHELSAELRLRIAAVLDKPAWRLLGEPFRRALEMAETVT